MDEVRPDPEVSGVVLEHVAVGRLLVGDPGSIHAAARSVNHFTAVTAGSFSAAMTGAGVKAHFVRDSYYL